MLRYIGIALVALILVLLGYYIVISQATSAPRSDVAVTAEFKNYFEGVQGYYATPTSGRRLPGIILVHEKWGLNDTVAAEAERLAQEGYRVLAVDLFEGAVANSEENTEAIVAAVDQGRALANMKAAETFLRDQGSSRIGLIGWDFGGGQALRLATAEETDIDAVVIYYGYPLITEPSALEHIPALIAFFGESDETIPTSNIDAFRAALNVAAVENEIVTYPGLGNAFADPANEGYAEDETRDAWQKTLTFFEDQL